MKSIQLDRKYTAAWLALAVFAGVMEISAPFAFGWDLLFYLIMGVEALAIADKDKGDTLSEHIWKFQEAGWARSILVGGITLWIVFRFTTLGTGPSVGRYLLAAGLGGWLLFHFFLRGRKG